MFVRVALLAMFILMAAKTEDFCNTLGIKPGSNPAMQKTMRIVGSIGIICDLALIGMDLAGYGT